MAIEATGSTLARVVEVVAKTLDIEDRVDTLNASTELFGSMPELDSLAVVELAAALESAFGFEIDESDFTGDVFETIGTLSDFVERNL